MSAKHQYSPEDMIIVGEITGAHGIKGQVKVECLTDFPEIRFAPGAELFFGKAAASGENSGCQSA